jgi:glycine rich protein/type IX secretion system substrate protein/Ig-like domain-containing protein
MFYMKRFYLSKLIILAALLMGLNSGAFAQGSTYVYTGGSQTYLVPIGVTSVAIDMQGAMGGNDPNNYGHGGYGGRVQCNLAVTGGQTLVIYVGGVGQNGNNCCGAYGGAGGFNGGGSNNYWWGAGGGGGSDVRASGGALSDRLVVAGGGGGGSENCGNGQQGGKGGGLTGEMGYECSGQYPCNCGAGGTQLTYGANATCYSATVGGPGQGGSPNCCTESGGGGGGYYGGGAGGYGGGGGGSSWTDPVRGSGVTHTPGFNSSGNGIVSICPGPIAGSITGTATVCPAGGNTQLSDVGGVGVGVWSSASPGTASIGSTGLVTGILPGTAKISYTISSSCASSSAFYTVTVLPKPTAYNLVGGGSFCAGGTGVDVATDGSDIGTTYKLYKAGVLVLSKTGTGAPIDYGLTTVAGTYIDTATINATGCSLVLGGSAVVTVNPLPNVYNVTAGGTAYCAGSPGYHVFLSTSDVGFSYQLYQGGVALGLPVFGTGALIDFGLMTAGTYSVVATNNTTGCFTNMSGTPTITVNPLPVPFTVTGGGHYCNGGTGRIINLSGSASGINYQLYLGGLAIGTPVSGSGSAISFGTQTAPGVYTVLAKNSTTLCTNNMTGSVTITVDPLPNVYTITGGGSYCVGGAGRDISLSGSDAGVTYQLMTGGVIVATRTGSGASVDFGLVSGAGTYTVVAVNPATTCTNNMAGSVTITVNPLPTLFTVLGGGGYCTGGTGRDVSLSFSNTGINYQLYNGFSPVGGPVGGTGFPIDFGLQTAAGTYTVRATNVTTGCNNNMSGSATVSISSLPVAQVVNGGGFYCSGGTGVAVGLNSSATGISYQLYTGGVAVGLPVAGTGGALSFGMQTVPGTYTVVATDNTTLCTNNMSGSATITVNPLPNPYIIMGGGGYCTGGAGFDLQLNGSDLGISYQLYNGVSPAGVAMAGTGSPLDFGIKTAPGTYTVQAINTSTTCSAVMTGASTISINPLPTVYPVSGGGNFCAGGVGKHVGLPFSSTGITYQLLLGGTPIGSPVIGTGAAIDFGLQTGTGSYTVVATNIVTGCTSNMSGSVAVTVTAAPLVYFVTATSGGAYCSGGTGVHIMLSGSNTGISYQLFIGGVPVGAPKVGTGTAIDFGLKTSPGTYSVVGTNATTGCSTNMSGTPVVTVNALPTAYSITGGGAYCSAGTGSDVALSMSDLTCTYELFLNGVSTGIILPGTGTMLDFGFQTLTGTYTVVATSTLTSCTSNMIGTAVISTLPLPTVFTVTGGGAYCSGDVAPHVMLSGSNTGISYQLLNTGSPSGAPMSGTSFGLDFGSQVLGGTYTVLATNAITGCQSTMTASAPVLVNALPTADTVTGGGSYCAGATGIHVGLKSSDAGMNYQLYNGGSPVGGTLLGSGSALDFGVMTAAGTYTVTAKNPATGCMSNQFSFATILINPTVIPGVNVTTPGSVVCQGTATTFTANPSNGGASPMYQWSVNGTSVAGATDATFTDTSLNLDDVSVTMTSNAACASPLTGSGEFTITVNPSTTPSVTILTDPGLTVCAGTTVVYTADPHHAGTAPTYSWTQGTAPLGTGINVTAIPANGDIISCLITSSDPCRLVDSTSSSVTMNVPAPVAPVVNLTVSPGKNIVVGQLDTVTATITSGGGPNPTYEWQINSVVQLGEVSNMLIRSTFNDHDSVTCIVTGSGLCGGLPTAKSASLRVRNTTAVNQVTSLLSDVRVVPNPNKGLFTIKGNVGSADDQQVSLEITNMLGQVVYKNTITAYSGNINEQIKLNNSLANGMYILNVRSGTENSAFHFVMEQ